MSLHLQRAMEHLRSQLLSLCTLVEEQSEGAVRALMERDPQLAEVVEKRDAAVDQCEVAIEEECLKTLALYQPVAIDLRFVVAVLKMNNDLERIGDLAVNIARKAAAFAQLPPMPIPFDLPGMWAKTRSMLRDSIQSLVNHDAVLAHSVCLRDDDVDRLKRQIRKKAAEMMANHPTHTSALLTLMAVSRNLERIADHATNVAEDVLYMVQGRIVRHETTD
ncbi:MAG: phosphate signaling complex protein PhoU [Planctomycetes bacterium]|nr:phosphate signaling complex protein PhoU [Planctomycetota bacterium]